MLSLAFLNHYAPIWLLVVLIILIYGGLKAIKVPGTDQVLAIASFLISFIIISSDKIVSYIVSIIPVVAIILTVSFAIILTISFTAGDIATFKKPLAYVGFGLAIVLVLVMAFNSFPTLNSIFPNASNTGLSSGMISLKNTIYTQTFKDSALFVGCLALVGFLILKKDK